VTKADQAEMLNAKVTLLDIIVRISNTYNINERWVVKKMKSKYVNGIVAILLIIY